MIEITPNDFNISMKSITPIITGKCNARRILSFKTSNLVKLLQKLARFEQIRSTIETLPTRSPAWWPNHQPYEENLGKLKPQIGDSQWREFILHLITHSVTFYKQAPVNAEHFLKRKAFFVAALKEELRSRKEGCVETALIRSKKDYDLYLERRKHSRPRKLETGMKLFNHFPVITPTEASELKYSNFNTCKKIGAIKKFSKENYVPKKELIKKIINSPQIVIKLTNIIKPTINKIQIKRMVVKLRNILQPPIIKKIDQQTFMQCLHLSPNKSKSSLALKTDKYKIMKYNTKIPFSSELGRSLIADNYKYSPRIYNRRLEKINYYLSDAQLANKLSDKQTQEYEVTYSKRRGFERFYTFPGKRYKQNKTIIDVMEKMYCKPVVVKLARIDVDEYLLKKFNFRECSVVINKTNFT